MEFFSQNWPIVLLALTSGGMLIWTSFKGAAGTASVSPSELVLLMNREKAVVVDIDTQSDVTIQGAKRLSLDELDASLPTAAKNKKIPLIFVCKTGMQSRAAVKKAKAMDYENVWILRGGMATWKAENMPTVAA